MNKYETVFIADPDLPDQARNALFDKVKSIIAGENGLLVDLDEWGNKKLAYEIRRKNRGHYVCVTYGGTGDLVRELERNFKLTEDVLKFMTIVLSKDVDETQLATEAQAASENRKKMAESAPSTGNADVNDGSENEDDSTDDDNSDDKPESREAATQTDDEDNG